MTTRGAQQLRTRMPQSEEKRLASVCKDARAHCGNKYYIRLADVCMYELKRCPNKMEQEGVKHTIQGRRHSPKVHSHNQQATSSIHLLGVLHPFPLACTACQHAHQVRCLVYPSSLALASPSIMLTRKVFPEISAIV
jgi:hypothetical protein